MTESQAKTVISCAVHNLSIEQKAKVRYHLRIGTPISSIATAASSFSPIPTSETAALNALVAGINNMPLSNVHGIHEDEANLLYVAQKKLGNELRRVLETELSTS